MEILHFVYSSPIGPLHLTADEHFLLGCDFFAWEGPCKQNEVIDAAIAYLDAYFAKKPLPAMPKLSLHATPFRSVVYSRLKEIPYGQTKSYGELAKAVGKALGKPKMSAQAIGGAMNHNPIVIFLPCHRVIGADGSLVGYGGGLEKKRFLLALEQA